MDCLFRLNAVGMQVSSNFTHSTWVSSQVFPIRDGPEPADELNFMINFAKFIVRKIKFVVDQPAQTFHKFSSCSWRFMLIHVHRYFQTISTQSKRQIGGLVEEHLGVILCEFDI